MQQRTLEIKKVTEERRRELEILRRNKEARERGRVPDESGESGAGGDDGGNGEKKQPVPHKQEG